MESSDEAQDESESKPPILSYRTPGARPPAETLQTLADMPAPEAAMARAKLDAEGIPSYVAGEGVSGVHPLLFSSVQLQVMEADLDRAREALERPAEENTEGEYTDEAWRCPKCHCKQIDILPLSAGYRRLRSFGILLFIVPLVIFMALSAATETELIKQIKETFGVLSPAWLLAVLIIAAIVMFSARGKKCRACGHEWKGEEGSS